ncbi:hypothetical protein GGI20_004138 [Coemansia sp. BCRC 34301]|nr:hypothetical protein GGI20_004138 [Coemansia sp. BCRC 34301]
MASVGSPQNGCPHDPPLIACPSGQTSYYVAQSSVECAHYICTTRPGGGGGGDDDGASSKKSVVLPAVLGSVLSAIAIGFGVFYYIIRRKRTGRAEEAQHQDAKYMSGYNNLGDDSFGTNPRSPGAYSSTYSVSKWRDSVFPAPGSPRSHSSIPIIFSQENSAEFTQGTRETKLYTGAHEPVFRETRLYPATAPTDEARQWASPNVVNVKQKPQLVVLDNSLSSVASGSGLGVNTANSRDLHSASSDTSSDTDSASHSGPNSPATPITPDTPDVPNIAQASTPMTTQMPRIVQVGRPQMIRALESSQKLEPALLNSPLRVETNGWDSDSDSDDAEEDKGVRDVESDAESKYDSDVESDVDGSAAPSVHYNAAPDANADANDEGESEYDSEYDSEYEYESGAEGGNGAKDESGAEDSSGAEGESEYESDSEGEDETDLPTPMSTSAEAHLTLLDVRPSLGSGLAFETSGDDSFFADVLKATASLDSKP